MKKITISAFALLISVSVLAQSSGTKTSVESTSVSISNSDHDYSVVATFSAAKSDRLKKLITQSLGSPNETGDNSFEWSLKNSYNVILRSGKLIIDMNKDKTAADLVKTFEHLGGEIRPALEGKK